MFDMDGLLLDTERVCLDAFVTTCAAFSLPQTIDPQAVFKTMVGLRSDDSDAAFRRAVGDHIDFAAFNPHWDQLIHQKLSQDVPVKAGADALLRQLTAMRVPVGVVTSTKTDVARRHLDAAGLLPFVADVLGGDQVKTGKPDPEGYIAMAGRLGQRPQDCAAFEDSNTGIRAAVTSGARAVQIPDLVPPTDEIRAFGHHIANDLLSGAKQVGLIP